MNAVYFCSATGKAMIRTTATGTCPRGYRKYVTAAKPGPAGPRGATGPAGAVGTLASTLSTSVDVGSSSFHNVAQVAVTSGHQYVAQWSVETVVGSPTTIYCDLENYLQGTSTFVTLPHGPRQLSVQSGDEAMSGSWSGTTPNTGTVYLV